MGFMAPETWILNMTMITLVFITEDEFGHRIAQKRIKPGGYIAVSYRKGHSTIGPKKHFWVHPENRPDLRGPEIMPSQVFHHANIIVGYKLGVSEYQDGASVGYRFEDRTTFRRIGLVRRVERICASLPKFGNCYYTSTPTPTPTPTLTLVTSTTGIDAMVLMVAPTLGETLALVKPPAPARPVTQGNCWHAGSVLAPVEAQPLLVVAQVPADPSPQQYSEIGIVTNGAAQAPNPPPNASL